MADKNYFEVLNSVDVSKWIEKKNGLSYLSWANCWAELKKRHPEAIYTIYENEHGWNYFTDGRTCWVKTGVTVNSIEHIEYLPVMDFRNKSINAENVTSFDVNKAIQRSLTKAVARHGLGLYIYAGEDLPEDAEPPKPKKYVCDSCGSLVKDANGATAEAIAMATHKKYGKCLCYNCITKQNEEAKKNVETIKDSGIPVEVHE